jgi:hypothetical protein
MAKPPVLLGVAQVITTVLLADWYVVLTERGLAGTVPA